jgi:tRNA(Ile)-lysidine synthase TilS/MesJ
MSEMIVGELGDQSTYESVALPDTFLEQIRSTTTRYGLVESGAPVIVALSGGKDSLILALGLREIGHPVIPVVVDMGYETGWASRVSEQVKPLGLSPEIIDVRKDKNSEATKDVILQIRSRIDILNEMGTLPDNRNTPCTHCYSVKALSLYSASKRHGVPQVAFGHHGTDAAASLIKEGLMHVDRWDSNHEAFSRLNYAKLVDEFQAELLSFDNTQPGPIMRRIAELAESGVIDTDEPPRQRLIETADDVSVIRPMFSVRESTIIAIKQDRKLQTEASGCGHGATDSTADGPRPRPQRHLGHGGARLPRCPRCFGRRTEW